MRKIEKVKELLFGVKLIAILYFVLAFISFFYGNIIIMIPTFIDMIKVENFVNIFYYFIDLSFVLGIASSIIPAAIFIIVGVGLLKRKRWARISGGILMILILGWNFLYGQGAILNNLVDLFPLMLSFITSNPNFSPVTTNLGNLYYLVRILITNILGLLIILYLLLNSKVKLFFNK